MLLVKKYPNRRLYDTRHSRYITLEDLEKLIRAGEDVAIQDASDGRDLTQETLTQLILDRGGGRILPTSLLLRLIRLDDAALAEFLTRYVGWALDMYVGAKDRARALLPLNPLATAPFAATDALARLVLGAAQWGRNQSGAAAAPPQPSGFNAPPQGFPDVYPPDGFPAPSDNGFPPPPDVMDPALQSSAPPVQTPAPISRQEAERLRPTVVDEMDRLRREIDALKASMGVTMLPKPASKKKKAAAKRSKSRS